MPIRIQRDLPAYGKLTDENIFVMDYQRASTQDIRPLEIAILNLMPTKEVTETQLLRVLGNTALQVNIEFVKISSYTPKNVSAEHMDRFYKTFDEICHKKYDGMVITGAPVEKLEFQEVEYWDELCRIMEWTKTHVHSTFHICWGAQAALYYHYGIPKYTLDKKLFGVFEHKVVRRSSILMRGFDDVIMVPHSRHTSIKREDIEACPYIKILAVSEDAGVYAMQTEGGKQVFITGHSEYDPETLKLEYDRDISAGLPIDVPKNYYPDDDPSREPLVTWRAHANLLYMNWLNYFVYQSTPYDLDAIGTDAVKQ